MKKQIYKYGQWFIVVIGNYAICTHKPEVAKKIYRGGLFWRLVFFAFGASSEGYSVEALVNFGLAKPLTFAEYAKIGGDLND